MRRLFAASTMALLLAAGADLFEVKTRLALDDGRRLKRIEAAD